MTSRFALACVVVAACGGSSPRPAEPAETSAACVELPADANTPKGEFVLAQGYSDLRVYRIKPAGCATLIATVDPGGTLAFAYIGETQHGGMPDLSIETWLMHGDRRSQRFTWSGDQYVETGRAEEIPGPRR